MSGQQASVFRDGEGDAWFERNRDALLTPKAPDWVETLITGLDNCAAIASVCDLGCSNGWRLARLASKFASGARLYGVEASSKAVADGRGRYPGLDLREGVLDALPIDDHGDGPCELVIASFVLHWVDRNLLARTISEVDRVTAWGGHLVLADFLPDKPERRHYHHLPGRDVWTYKQDYAQAFLGLGTYREVSRVVFAHGQPEARSTRSLTYMADVDGRDIASADRCVCCVLQKTDKGYNGQ